MKNLKYGLIVICLFLVLLSISQIRSCINERISDDVEELEGRLEAYQAQAEEEKKALEEKIQARDGENEILVKENEESRKKQQKISIEMGEKDKEISRLEEEFSLIEDVNLKLDNALQQVEAWKVKFSLAMEDLKEEKWVSLRWEEVYLNEKASKEDVLAALRKRDSINEICMKALDGKNKQIKGIKLSRTAERIGGGLLLILSFALAASK